MSESTERSAEVDVAGPSSEGKERILDVAEQLFAERGTEGVSLREINAASGQRNASAVQYHFRNRSGLLLAIIERHMAVVDAAREAMLDELADTHGEALPSAHELMDTLMLPLAERLEDRSGRCYLRIIQHLVDQPDPMAGAELASEYNQSLRRAAKLLGEHLADYPPRIQVERRAAITSFMLRGLADRAKAVEVSGGAHLLAHDAWVANMVDMLVAVVEAPVSPATAEALTRRKK